SNSLAQGATTSMQSYSQLARMKKFGASANLARRPRRVDHHHLNFVRPPPSTRNNEPPTHARAVADARRAGASAAADHATGAASRRRRRHTDEDIRHAVLFSPDADPARA